MSSMSAGLIARRDARYIFEEALFIRRDASFRECGSMSEDVNYEWFLKADLGNYKGLYVAIAEGRVVESGEDPKTVYSKAREKQPSAEVVLWKVPSEETLIL